jgi:hypothetical protein
MNEKSKLIFETTSNNDTMISAFAYDVGIMIEDLIRNRTNDLEAHNKYLEAKILQYHYKLSGEEKEKYAKYFEIKTHE